MSGPKSRRNFMKSAIAAGMACPALHVFGGTAEKGDDEIQALRIRFQQGLAEERAVLFRIERVHLNRDFWTL